MNTPRARWLASLLALGLLTGCGTTSGLTANVTTSSRPVAMRPSEATSPTAREPMNTTRVTAGTQRPSSPMSATGTPRTPTHASEGSTCQSATVSITLGPRISPETGEHGLLLQLVNTSGRVCNLQGYLTVSFRLSGSSVGHPIPPARGVYVTTASPSLVTLRPRGEAYVLIATYRCDLGVPATVGSLAASLPHSTTITTVALPGTGVSALPYCPGQPGHTAAAFEMSPIEATIAATAHA